MLDRLKSLFIIEEETPTKKSPELEDTTPAKPVSPTGPTPVSRSTNSRVPSKGKVDSKFTEILFGALEKNNQDGFDYLEFKQSLRNLAKMPMDESTRFKSAYAMAQTMGVTPTNLVESAKYYVTILSSEKAKFQRAVDHQEEKQIGDRKDTLQQLDAVVKEKTQMIEQLKKEIEEAKKQREQVSQAIDAAHTKVVQTKNDFFASYQALVGQIEKDIENMERYLK